MGVKKLMTMPDFTETELATEEWRGVVGREQWYEVSNLGQVRRVNSRLKISGHLRACLRRGYLCVSLSCEGVCSTPSVHGLVAAAFIGPRPIGRQINHRDFQRTNNRVTNLEYLTPRENQRYSSKRMSVARRKLLKANPHLVRRGEAAPDAKLSAKQIPEIRQAFRSGVTIKQIAVRYQVAYSTIRRIVNRIYWAHIADSIESLTSWEYWRNQAKDESRSIPDRFFAWEQAYNHLENARHAAESWEAETK